MTGGITRSDTPDFKHSQSGEHSLCFQAGVPDDFLCTSGTCKHGQSHLLLRLAQGRELF